MQVPVGQRAQDPYNSHVRVGGGHEFLKCPQKDRPIRRVSPPTRHYSRPNVTPVHSRPNVIPINTNTSNSTHVPLHHSRPVPVDTNIHFSSSPSHEHVGTGVSRFKTASWINKLGYIPGIGTIVGIIRIAIAALRLPGSHSPIKRHLLHEEIKRGMIEMIPFIGGGILIYKDRH